MFYERYCAKVITDIIQVVVGLGLVTLLMNYVYVGTGHSTLLNDPEFRLRCVLLLLTILFATYHLIGYIADFATAENNGHWEVRTRSPSKIILLFMLDLTAVGIVAAMFAVLYVTDEGSVSDFDVVWADLSALAGLAASWHGLMLVWHLIAGPRVRALLTHIAMGVSFLALSCLAYHDGNTGFFTVSTVFWTALFAIVVALLYFVRGRRLIRNAIATVEKSV